MHDAHLHSHATATAPPPTATHVDARRAGPAGPGRVLRRSHSPAPAGGTAVILLDAHAHLHPGFPLDAFLDGAWEHFRRLASPRTPGEWTGCLFVAGTASAPVGPRLARAGEGGREPAEQRRAGPPAWSVGSDDGGARTARHRDGRELLLVLGTQLETEEGVELLRIGASDPPRGRRPELRRAISEVREAGGLAVLPWGFGKWTLGRKRLLLAGLEAWAPGEVALADSAARPAALPPHPVLTRARRLGHPVLGGTDPLPFPSHARRAGSFAAKLGGSLEPGPPWPRLRARLTSPDERAELVGRRDGLATLLLHQARLRLR